jgi:transposase
VRNITTVGVDLAKNLFQVHGVDDRGKVVLRRALKRADLTSFFARLAPCLIGMEACGGAHFWARKLSELGHTVRLMAPQFVKPYVKTNKNDARDAEAICEAVARPNVRFVPIKTVEQQALLTVHRARQAFVSARTAQSNQLRGLLSEFGIVMPKGIAVLEQRMPQILEDAENGVPGVSRELFTRLYAHFKELSEQMGELERQIKAWHRENSTSQRLEAIPGIGPLTASALAASNRGCEGVQEWPTAGRLAGSGPTPVLQRRQRTVARDQQARRFVSTHAAHSRRSLGADAAQATCRSG